MTPENRDLFKAHALSAMPVEACGVVIVERGREVLVPCRNVSTIDHSFAIDPEEFAAAEDRGDVVRIVHSHCYGSPRPSEVDLVSCEHTGVAWSIVSVPNGDWYDFTPSGYRAPLVGREWAHGILDCYSLIVDHYRETLGIALPDFARDHEWWLKGGNLYLDNFASAGFSEVKNEPPRAHDVLLMQIASPVPNHAGIYLGDDKFLHHLHRRLSCRDIWGGYYLKNTVKVLRHENCSTLR